MRAHIMKMAIRLTLLPALLMVHLPSWAAKVPLVEANHMRWEKSDVVLGNVIA